MSVVSSAMLRAYPGGAGNVREVEDLLALPTDELLARAAAVRDAATGTRVTFSPKVFIPLTELCQDRCGYCTFAKPPARLDSPYLRPERVLEIARAGAAAGCSEALFTLGENVTRVPVAASRAAAARASSSSVGSANRSSTSRTLPAPPG